MSDQLVPADVIALMCIYSFGDSLPEFVTIPNSLLERGLISVLEDNGMTTSYSVTEGGEMLIKAICKTPVPIKRWSMP